MRNRRRLGIVAIVAACVITWIAWQFRPPPEPPALPADFHADRAAWMGVTWAMDPHADAEVEALAAALRAHGITYGFFYLSYLRADDTFNPTWEHAAAFVARLRTAAPEVALLAWVGIPIQATTPAGTYLDNRLAHPDVREQIATFAVRAVSEFDFDGVHLNAELIRDGDAAYLALLDTVRAALPPDATLSAAVHALRLDEHATVIPYPAFDFHLSPGYAREIAARVDQVAVMTYDSGLFFPVDYRAWMAYQVRRVAAALADTDAHILIGVPASEEWTLSHHVMAEYPANALAGLREGLTASEAPGAIDGIAVYPYWEVSDGEWAVIDALP
ncbi:MAG: hypothetical protein JW910_01765 [Anaerolineae bacterium]|nr:hypothetical protein [Anaerolineae bacterium]